MYGKSDSNIKDNKRLYYKNSIKYSKYIYAFHEIKYYKLLKYSNIYLIYMYILYIQYTV